MRNHKFSRKPACSRPNTEDLKVFSDGRVLYKKQGNDRKDGSFNSRLTPQKLQQLAALTNSQPIRSLPPEIPSQIRTIDYNWEKKMNLYRNGSQQTMVMRDFYPL